MTATTATPATTTPSATSAPASQTDTHLSDASTRFGSGQAVRRLEDDALLAGQGRFTDDFMGDASNNVDLQAQSRLVFVRSPYPHARIASIDASAARAMPGVLHIATGADLVAAGVKPMAGSVGFKRADGTPSAAPPRRALAHEVVRFVGEPVAAVVALTLQQARDAAEAIAIDYDELHMAVDMDAATASGATALCAEAPDNIAAETRYGNAQATTAAFASARHVVKLEIVNQRLSPLSLEPRSVLAAFDTATKRLTIRLSTQMPTGVRNTVCDAMGLAPKDVRVLVGDVGGGFGMKTGAYPEDIAVAFCAHALQRPVKWVAERSEEFISGTHGRDLHSHAELALADDGKILALRLASRANVGAYPTGAGIAIQLLIGPWVQTSVYDIQTVDFHFQAVMTNTSPTGPYRGAGRPEAIFTMERLMDEAARQTGIDRIALRRRNFIAPAQMPYTNPMGQTYDSGQFERVMDKALVLADWNGFAARAAESKQRGLLRGQGISTFLEWTGGNALEERVTLEVRKSDSDDGIIEIFTAVNGMGQGIQTSLAQLMVDAFGVPMEQIRVVMGDTDRGDGFGSAGSRSLFTGGSALQVGAERTIANAKKLAAKELEAAGHDIEYANGRFKVSGTDVGIDIFTLAGKQPGQRIFIESVTAVAGPSWPNGCHISEVEIDPQTGHVAVVAYASVNDVGRVVNPMIVRGQLDGGAVQGIGQALCEHLVYDVETGQPLTGSLMDYAAPRAGDTPPFKTEMDSSTPCLNNPIGVKGVGELGTIGAGPTVVNAVADALARGGRAAQTSQLQMPLTASKLWHLMQSTG